MIAACPKCSARYRIERDRLRPEGVRLRCSRCEAVFRVRAPESRPEARPAPEPVAAVEPPPPPRAAAAAPQRSDQDSPPPRPLVAASKPAPADCPEQEAAIDPERLVLVADPMTDEGKATAAALAAWGMQSILVHDGVEAILTIQRRMPRAAIIDAALPKMYGFQICELLKRNESLRHIHVVLVGAIHDRNRYRRSPTEIYGADAYLERPQLPDALWPILRGFGLPVSGGIAAPESPRPRPAPAARREPAPPPPPAEPMLDAEVAKAERLARIVVSDIILYNQEKFDAAVRAGNVLEAMSGDLEEGRALFAQRIDARVREQRDFLAEELVRVAGTRRPQ